MAVSSWVADLRVLPSHRLYCISLCIFQLLHQKCIPADLGRKGVSGSMSFPSPEGLQSDVPNVGTLKNPVCTLCTCLFLDSFCRAAFGASEQNADPSKPSSPTFLVTSKVLNALLGDGKGVSSVCRMLKT